MDPRPRWKQQQQQAEEVPVPAGRGADPAGSRHVARVRHGRAPARGARGLCSPPPYRSTTHRRVEELETYGDPRRSRPPPAPKRGKEEEKRGARPRARERSPGDGGPTTVAAPPPRARCCTSLPRHQQRTNTTPADSRVSSCRLRRQASHDPCTRRCGADHCRAPDLCVYVCVRYICAPS